MTDRRDDQDGAQWDDFEQDGDRLEEERGRPGQATGEGDHPLESQRTSTPPEQEA